MRIIGGLKAGLRFQVPKNLPVRPTTDLAKEALFNILQNKLDLEEIELALDLFSGTGGISLELASRGVKEIHAVDLNYGCINHLKNTSEEIGFKQIKCFKANALQYIKKASNTYNLMFADPPFDMDKINILPELVQKSGILHSEGLFIIEHPSTLKMTNSVEPVDVRKYGYSTFSFYQF